MFKIQFYETSSGESDVWDFLEELRIKSATNKDVRIQFNQMASYIDLLSKNGTRMPEKITKLGYPTLPISIILPLHMYRLPPNSSETGWSIDKAMYFKFRRRILW